MRRIGTGIVMTLAAVVLAACGTTAHSGPGLLPDASGNAPWTSCADEVPDPSAAGVDPSEGPLPWLDDLGFVPTAVVVCDQRSQKRAGGGEDLVAVESRGTDVAALVAALRLPDATPTNGACTLDLPGVPWFALLDEQDRWVRPRLPLDECRKIRIELREATDRLRLTTVQTRVLAQLESAEAAAAGCSQNWADMVAVETGPPHNSTLRAPTTRPNVTPLVLVNQVRLCAYRVPVGEQGSGKPAGDFTHGGVLTPQRRTDVENALAAAGPALRCARPAGRFALLRAADGSSGEVYVELDGCQRILIGAPTGRPVLAQGGTALTRLLDH